MDTFLLFSASYIYRHIRKKKDVKIYKFIYLFIILLIYLCYLLVAPHLIPSLEGIRAAFLSCLDLKMKSTLIRLLHFSM